METTATATKKWTTTAGKVTTNRINKALSSLRWAGKGYTELSGVIGGEEYRAVLTPMFTGSLSPVCIAAMDRIGEQYDYTVTPGNHKALEADIIAAIKEVEAARPVVDNRRTPEDETARIAERNAQHAEQKAKAQIKQAADAVAIAALAKEYPYLERLEGSKKSPHALTGANIRAILSRNFPGHVFKVTTESFSGGDSCNVHYTDGPTEKEVKALINRFEAGSFDGMEDIYENTSDIWHKLFGDIKYLFVDRKISPERFTKAGISENIPVVLTQWGGMDRDKMDEFGMRQISEHIHDTSFYTAPTPTVPAATPTANFTDGDQNGPRIVHNTALNGIEIHFPQKPAQSVIDTLKAEGWRWSMRNKCWYQKASEAAEAQARRILEQ